MTFAEIPNLRLANQQISSRKFDSVKELVSYMGAIQAQDYPMAKWAVGLRLSDASEQTINEAIDKGDIFRTHLLRPTWHFVSADDIKWMLDLTSLRIKSSMSSRNRQLVLTETVFKKSNKIIQEALTGNNHLTREELIKLLNKGKIKTDQNRASHILAEAELSGIICSGKSKGNKHTYALFEERVPDSRSLTKEQSIAKLAMIYFSSRGPALLQDFAWWSGLTLTNAKDALNMIKSELISVEMNSKTYWLHNTLSNYRAQKESVYLLPTFDEYTISYNDRSAVLISKNHRSIISTNGIFRALIVAGGKVTGTWKRTIKKDKVILKMNCFEQPNGKIKRLIENEAERFARFLGKDMESSIHIFV